jgi:hypothetical protein
VRDMMAILARRPQGGGGGGGGEVYDGFRHRAQHKT